MLVGELCWGLGLQWFVRVRPCMCGRIVPCARAVLLWRNEGGVGMTLGVGGCSIGEDSESASWFFITS